MPQKHTKLNWAGMTAAALFVLIFTVEGSLRPGYSALRTEVSALSLGSRGWIQILNFILSGGLLLLFATGLLKQFRREQRPTLGPILLVITASCLLLSGPFVMDPPGTPRSLWTGHGWVHQLLGAVVFTLFPISCFVVGRAMQDRVSFRGWSRGAGWLIIAALVGMKLAQTQPTGSFFAVRLGLFQRVALITYLTWVFTLSVKVRQSVNQ